MADCLFANPTTRRGNEGSVYRFDAITARNDVDGVLVITFFNWRTSLLLITFGKTCLDVLWNGPYGPNGRCHNSRTVDNKRRCPTLKESLWKIDQTMFKFCGDVHFSNKTKLVLRIGFFSLWSATSGTLNPRMCSRDIFNLVCERCTIKCLSVLWHNLIIKLTCIFT